MKCIAVDDDQLFLTILEGFISKTESLELIQSFNNSIDAYNFLENNQVDLAFLDVEMPEMSGIELIKSLEKQPQIIIVSSEQKYVIDAFNLNVSGYLLKPLDDYAAFLTAVKKVENTTVNSRDAIFVKVDQKLIKINLSDILFIEAYGDYIKLNTSDKVYVTYITLKEFANNLPSADFIQTHRSYIVRVDKIDEVEGNMLHVGKKTVPISKNRKDDIMNSLQKI